MQPVTSEKPRVPRAVRRLKGAMGVSPHVGKSEGAKPRRMEYLAITKAKDIYLFFKN